MSHKDFADKLASIPLIHQPGEEFTYGWNSDLLGRLIEIWSGQELDEFIHESLFKPLAMNDTFFVVPQEKRDRYAPVYVSMKGNLTAGGKDEYFFKRQKFVSGGGGLITTMPDFANLCQMLVEQGEFNGRSVLKPEAVKLIFTKQVPNRSKKGLE